MHSSMQRPRRDSSLTMSASPSRSSFKTAAILYRRIRFVPRPRFRRPTLSRRSNGSSVNFARKCCETESTYCLIPSPPRPPAGRGRGFFRVPGTQLGLCGRAGTDITLCEMSRLVRDLQLVDARGRKYLATDECQRFLETASIRIRTPKCRAEVPVPPALLRALEIVHALRSMLAKAAEGSPGSHSQRRRQGAPRPARRASGKGP